MLLNKICFSNRGRSSVVEHDPSTFGAAFLAVAGHISLVSSSTITFYAPPGTVGMFITAGITAKTALLAVAPHISNPLTPHAVSFLCPFWTSMVPVFVLASYRWSVCGSSITLIHQSCLLDVLRTQSSHVSQFCATVFPCDCCTSASKSSGMVMHYTVIIIRDSARVNSA